MPGCVVITGASGSVGAAVARVLAQHEMLALLDHHQHPPPQLGAGARFESIGELELSDEAAVAAALTRVREQLGPMRALVHTAGAFAAGVEVRDQSAAMLRHMLEANLVSAASTVRAMLPDLLAAEHARIVLFASAHALHGHAGASAYAAAKAGLLRFAESLAEEVNPRGVAVHVIVPTIVDTPQNRAAMPGANFADWVTPDEIAATVAFLLSPAASGIRHAAIAMGR